jgi:hypothetical protein
MPIIGNNSSAGKKPTTPTIETAVDGGTGTTVNVPFTASTYIGKDTITYTALSSPGSISATSSGTPITVTGLTTGTAYTFSVTGNTNYGVASDASTASNSVTPIVPSSFESIAAVGGAGANFMTFSNIPQTYKHLQVRFWGREVSSNTNQPLWVRINGTSSAAYFYNRMAVSNGSGGDAEAINISQAPINNMLWGNTSGTYALTAGAASITFFDYASTERKTWLTLASASNQGGTGTTVQNNVAYLDGSQAISSITLLTGSGSNFSNETIMSLYGIRGL